MTKRIYIDIFILLHLFVHGWFSEKENSKEKKDEILPRYDTDDSNDYDDNSEVTDDYYSDNDGENYSSYDDNDNSQVSDLNNTYQFPDDKDEDFSVKMWPQYSKDYVIKDKPLMLLMQNRRDDILEEHNVDILDIVQEDRRKIVNIKVKAKFRCDDCGNSWTSYNAGIDFDMYKVGVSRM